MSDSSLRGRMCLVTGAANGLGAACAIGLADAGATLFLCDRDLDGLQVTAHQIEKKHGFDRVWYAGVDVTVESDVAAAVDTAKKVFGRIDVLLNNAGTGPHIVRPDYISRPLHSWDVPVDKWRRIIEINAIAPFAFSHAVLPGMLERGWGRIINVSTTWETMLRPGFASYGPSKAALEAMSAAMARELQDTGITVNMLHPGGPVDTAQVPADIGVPRDKLLRPGVMVPALVWLCSEAAGAVSGRRITAALWKEDRPSELNLSEAGEPTAWPQLVRPIVMPQRGML